MKIQFFTEFGEPGNFRLREEDPATELLKEEIFPVKIVNCLEITDYSMEFDFLLKLNINKILIFPQ